MYAHPTPMIKVSVRTPNNKQIELKIYWSRKVFFRTSTNALVVSKKLENTVNIGIATTNEIKNDVMYQIFIFLNIKMYVN